MLSSQPRSRRRAGASAQNPCAAPALRTVAVRSPRCTRWPCKHEIFYAVRRAVQQACGSKVAALLVTCPVILGARVDSYGAL